MNSSSENAFVFIAFFINIAPSSYSNPYFSFGSIKEYFIIYSLANSSISLFFLEALPNPSHNSISFASPLKEIPAYLPLLPDLFSWV